MTNLRPLLILLLIPLLGNEVFSQNKIYETYDDIVGLDNTGLYNGTEFTDVFLNTDGTYRYFNGFDYVKGAVTYNNQYYSNVFLKYDLLEDNLLTRSDDNLSVFNVKLIPDFIESFSIYNRNFVRLTNTNLGVSGNEFFEASYIGNDLQLYIKHSKKKRDRALKTGIQYRFSEVKTYVLKSGENYAIINLAKDLKKILPEKEDAIKEFYKTYKTLYKTNPDSFMTKLIKNMETTNQ